jgi:hypothetical protein
MVARILRAAMANRQQEKEARRQARLAAEREAAEREARGRRLRLIGGAALIVVAVVAVVVVLAAGGGGGDKNGDKPKQSGSNAKIPERQITDLGAAAKAAGCTLTSYPKQYEDRGHVPDSTKLKFKENPPVAGKHYESPASDGNYAGQGTPPPGNWLHSLEHGRIEYQYKKGTPEKTVKQLEALFDEDPDLVMVLENNTNMKPQVAALAWTHIAACPTMNDKVFDVFRAFREKYRLKGPEVIPQPE